MKASAPKKSGETKALEAAQLREIARQDALINEKKRKIIRAQTVSRASMLSGHMASDDAGGSGTGQAAPGRPGRTGRRAGGLGGRVAGGGGGYGGGRGARAFR